MISLLTRGDDAASSRSANRAMYEAARYGLLRNIGVMAPCPFLDDAAEVFRGLDHVAFGMHFTLNSEWDEPRWSAILPQDKVPALYDREGRLFSETVALYEAKVPLEQMMAEAEAQLALLRKKGFRLVYIDDHMGVSWLPGLREALADFAKREGLIFQPQLRSLPKIDESRFSAEDYAGKLMASLELAEPGQPYLLVGHPTYDDTETASIRHGKTPYGFHARDRNGQRLLFLRPDVVTYIREKGIRLLRYDELGGQ